MFGFVEREKACHRVAIMCHILGVSTSGYYRWSRSGPCLRSRRDLELTQRIRQVHVASRGTYGSPRVHAELTLGQGIDCGRKRVARLMRAAGLVGIHRRLYHGITRRDPRRPVFPDHVGRDFMPKAPNRLWVADLTQHPTGEGWLYAGVVLDAFSRRVVGWAMGDRPVSALPVNALRMATGKRSPVADTVHHSDHGAQYTSLAFGETLIAPSTKTLLKDHGHYGFEEYCDHNMHFGVHEHAMGAIVGGMAIHGGTIPPYAATFLIFSDYMRPPMRLAALMGQRVIYIFTHDSIGVGEDGPTHQPIEQLMGLRGVPNLGVMRPADATETLEAWKVAIERRDGPTALVFSRQNLPVLDRTVMGPAEGVRMGGYVLWEASPRPQVILIATGSEVHIALETGRLLEQEGIAPRVVSLPSWDVFDAQPREYRDQVLPPDIRARVSIEAGSPMGWERYVGLDGVTIGLPHFGASAPAQVLYQKFGLTAERMVAEAKGVLQGLRR